MAAKLQDEFYFKLKNSVLKQLNSYKLHPHNNKKFIKYPYFIYK